MILQALYDYYNRLASDPDSGIAPEGFEVQEKITFLVIINQQGHFVDLEDTREGSGKQQRAKKFLVPKGIKRQSSNSWQSANLLWDNAKYLLGFPDPKEKNPEKAKEDAAKCHESFKKLVFSSFSSPCLDEEVSAVISFLENGDYSSIFAHPLWAEFIKSNGNLTFKVQGQYRPLVESETVSKFVSGKQETSLHESSGICLVTGSEDIIESKHPSIKGLPGQTTGGNIISFNCDAVESYSKKQGDNSPVGKKAAFAYTTALNHLLSTDSRQKLNVANTMFLFWAEQSHPIEDLLPDLFGQPSQDNPDKNIEAVKALYKSPWTGLSTTAPQNTKFYILGLRAPNKARIAICFWEVTTIQNLAANIRQHFEDISICHGPNQSDYLPLSSLLQSTAVQGKKDNIIPNLASETVKNIMTGCIYPTSLLLAVLQRIRIPESDQLSKWQKEERLYWRAALIKGCINRYTRKVQTSEKELTMSLDETNTNIGYCLGRLFSVLEKVQEESHPGINATIRDRYYSSASSTPIIAFVPLMRLNKHHLAKLENRGRVVNFERLISRIMEYIADYPKLLNLQDQGRFAIGYYHQRQAFFTKNSDSNETTSAEPAVI